MYAILCTIIALYTTPIDDEHIKLPHDSHTTLFSSTITKKPTFIPTEYKEVVETTARANNIPIELFVKFIYTESPKWESKKEWS